EFKDKHPKCNPQAQKRKSGRPALKYAGADAEFTDSSDDEGSRATDKSTGARARKVGSAKKGVEEKEANDDGASEMTSKCYSGDGSGEGEGRSLGKGKRGGGGGDARRQGKRAKVVGVADGVAEDPTCFYCQKAAGQDAKDELMYCADFDCNRRVHMKCCTPPLKEVPDRFYCQRCVDAGKDTACEDPCLACGSNDRDDLILVCDRDKCYNYFHCYCLPQPLDAPPE
ncbi:unnamed protein product, partial [Ectocarpus sp. 8 AP-2014]